MGVKKALDGKGKFQIGYDAGRYNEIIEAALNPRPEANGNNWQVNALLWGPKGPQSMLKDCVIVKFKLNWDDKKRETGEHVAFQTPDGLWHYLNSIRSTTMTHKSLKEFGDVHVGGLSKQHHLTLSMMDAPEQKIKNTIKGSCPTNAWNLFRACFKEVHGSCEAAACSSMYKVKKQAFNDLLKSKKNSNDLLKAGCAIINK